MSSGFTEKYKGQHFKAVDSTNAMEAMTKGLEKESPEWLESENGYNVDYFRVVRDRGKRVNMRWGMWVDMSYDNGLVGYAQSDTFRTLEDAKTFIEFARKVINNWYCGFGIRKTTYDKKTNKLDIEVIVPCECVNATKTTIDELCNA